MVKFMVKLSCGYAIVKEKTGILTDDQQKIHQIVSSFQKDCEPMPEKFTYLNAFLELFYPRLYLVCGQKLRSIEEDICMRCLLHLPRTNFHQQPNNPMEQLFYGRV